MDNKNSKALNTEQVGTRILDRDGRIWDGPRFPMDSTARYTFYSRMGGFVPTEVAIDTVFTNPLHYGAGGFEGVRLVRTPYGDGFVELPHNIARFIYSSLAFDPTLQLNALKILGKESNEFIRHAQRTPNEFYADSSIAQSQNGDIKLALEIHCKNKRVKKIDIPVRMKVKFGDKIKSFSLGEIHAAMCSLAFLNDLVRYDPYPATIQQVDAGYFRPVFWVSGEEGLKVPTVIQKDGKLISKPLYFAIGTLPWKQYLNAEHYERGLNVLLAPLPRVNNAMPFKQKIAGVYVNSALNINISQVLNFQRAPENKFGEILAMNSDGRVVEGSAENILVLFTHKKTGALRVYSPPLSANILPGTTRDRMLRVLGQGMQIGDVKSELIMEAPHKNMLINGLTDKSPWALSAIVMLGTGVGLIHVRSLTENTILEKLLRIDQLRSEEETCDSFMLGKMSDHEKTYLINEGKKHPFVDALQQAYAQFVLSENGSKIYTPYDMNPLDLETIMGVGLEEVAGGREFRKKSEDGHFKVRVNGLIQPDELTSRYREVASVVSKMNKKSIEKRTAPKPAKIKIGPGNIGC